MTAYRDIKDQVIERTHSLKDVAYKIHHLPLGWYTTLLNYRYELSHTEHPSIECITHALMHLDDRRYNIVFSVLVDGVPAFLFLGGGREGRDNQHYYPLNNEACKKCVQYMVELVPEAAPKPLPPEVGEDVDIEALVEFNGVGMLYGNWYYRDRDDNWVEGVD